MRLRIAIALVLAISPFASQLGKAQVARSVAQQMGLETAWQSQVQLPRVGTGLVSSHLWAEPTNPRKFAVVELADRTIRIAADTVDRDGDPIGIELAKERAQQQAARALGKSDGFQVVEVSVPRIKLILISSDGLVQALDAETGKLIWSSVCGHSRAPAFPGAVSPAGVSVIHGENLYLLDWATGKHRMAKPLRFSTSSALTVCNDIAYVSDFTGRVQAYGLGRSYQPWGYVIKGRAIGQPVNLQNNQFGAIASDAGYVYVFASGEKPNVWIRYESSSKINGSLSAGNGAFYAGTATGVVSKISVEDRLGIIKWEFSLGRTVTAPPLVVSDMVVAASEAGDLVAIDDGTGIAKWTAMSAGIRLAIGKSGDNLLCLSTAGQLVALNAETGRTVARSGVMDLSRPVVNQMNDRIYLVTKNGQIQCLRPVGAPLPTMNTPVVQVEEEEESTQQTTTPETNTNESPFNFGDDTGNPFGGDTNMSNPFDGGATNPFGGDAGGDPFQTGSGSGSGSGSPF